MSNPFDVDIAVNCKTIFDCHRCALCDNVEGIRMRYPCGHTACIDCATSKDCVLCSSNLCSEGPVIDSVLSARVEKAVNLLNVHNKVFSVDVYKKQRLSEKLKIEKELFPQCIQAPFKYYNKRKSVNNTYNNKENKLQFPGQEISSSNINMENKFNFVKKWLTDNQSVTERKPFANLNINQRIPINRNENVLAKKSIAQYNTRKCEKRNKLLTKERRKNGSGKDYKGNLNFKNNIFAAKKATTVNRVNIKNTMDFNNDNKIIIIEDSQDIDKDKEACLQVLEADKQQLSLVELEDEFPNEIYREIQTPIESPVEVQCKVPFYRKGSLCEECRFCMEEISQNTSKPLEEISQNTSKPNDQDVSIVIDNKSFIATITVTKSVKSQTNSEITKVKHSVEVQNDSGFQDGTSILFELDKDTDTNKNKLPKSNDEEEKDPRYVKLHSQDIEMVSNKKKIIIIEESDSDDSDIIKGQSLEIKADIHRSCDDFDYGVLSQVTNEAEHSRKTRRPARGMTPDSSNSSEKENLNPNKPKRRKLDKKHYKKDKWT